MTKALRFFDAIARSYGDDWTIEEENRVMIRKILPEGENVLEIGCGNGLVLSNLPKTRRAVGVDFSWEMIAEARRRQPGRKLVLARAEALPFQPGSFDVVIAVNAIHNHREPRLWFAEVSRLRPRRFLTDYRNIFNFMARVKARRFEVMLGKSGVCYELFSFTGIKRRLHETGFEVIRRIGAVRPWTDPREGFRWKHLAGWFFSRIPGFAPAYVIEAEFRG